MWVLEGAEQAGLKLVREPGSVLSAALAEIDPIATPLGAGGVSVLNMMGSRWRKGPAGLEHIHEAARLRWVADPSYRPKPLAPFADEILDSVREAARAAA
jgi:hypothetical protein